MGINTLFGLKSASPARSISLAERQLNEHLAKFTRSLTEFTEVSNECVKQLFLKGGRLNRIAEIMTEIHADADEIMKVTGRNDPRLHSVVSKILQDLMDLEAALEKEKRSESRAIERLQHIIKGVTDAWGILHRAQEDMASVAAGLAALPQSERVIRFRERTIIAQNLMNSYLQLFSPWLKIMKLQEASVLERLEEEIVRKEQAAERNIAQTITVAKNIVNRTTDIGIDQKTFDTRITSVNDRLKFLNTQLLEIKRVEVALAHVAANEIANHLADLRQKLPFERVMQLMVSSRFGSEQLLRAELNL